MVRVSSDSKVPLLKCDQVLITQPEKQKVVTKPKAFNFQKSKGLKYTMPACHFDSHNLWILKPTHLNRGRGIHVFKDLDTLKTLVKQYCTGDKDGGETTQCGQMKFNTFIIQKYIERPLLIHRRKFDIRVWVCLT